MKRLENDYAKDLICDHCGGTAIHSDDGIFTDGDGTECEECKMPGSVSADEGYAHWHVSEEYRHYCIESDCVDCTDRGRL